MEKGVNSYRVNNKKCCECLKYKEEADVLFQEAKASRFQANEYTKSANDLFNTEQIYAQRINKLKEEARTEDEKSKEFEKKYNQCMMMLKHMSNKSYCSKSIASMCEECKYYERQYKELRDSSLEKINFIEELNEEKELLYEIASGHINDANLLYTASEERQAEAEEKMLEYEECIKGNIE